MSTTNTQHYNRKRGFSLVEIVVVMAIFVIVGLAIGSFSRDIIFYSNANQSALSAQQDALNIIRQMVSELRTASISNTGSYPLVIVASSSLRFYSDTDGDGLKDEIQYYLSPNGKTLYRNVLKPTGSPLAYTAASTTRTLISNITSASSTPIFQYYDGNYDGTTSALAQPVSVLSVRLIKITVSLDSDTNRSPKPLSVTSQVSLRNIKDNL